MAQQSKVPLKRLIPILDDSSSHWEKGMVAMPSKITAVRVELDYSVSGRRDITVTNGQGNHEYRREPNRAQYKQFFDKVLDNVINGTDMTFWIDDDGFLISDPLDQDP
jgi:hypothetical protein